MTIRKPQARYRALMERYEALEMSEAAIGDWCKLHADLLHTYVVTQTEIIALRQVLGPDAAPRVQALRMELKQLLELRVRVQSQLAEARASFDDRKLRRG